ncbi:MAG TPA: hypothetical protein VLJ59_07150 [Mycobacteriales bacterium]|nr:hypothetical protein [Mycobacteriales bacterium]
MLLGLASRLSQSWRAERADLAGWTVLGLAGLLASWLAVHGHARLGTASAPFVGSYRLAVTVATVLAPMVAVLTLVAAWRGWLDRLPWRALLLATYAAATAWALALALVDGGQGLAGPVTNPEEYLADVPRVGDDPAGFLRHFVGGLGPLAPATQDHPPLPVLLLWLLRRAGLTSPVGIGVVLTLAGTLTVPLLLVAVRSLCGEPYARRLAPVLALAPYAVWVAVSMDAVTATLGAALVTAGVLASEHGRAWWRSAAWAAGCGLLLGVAGLFSYSVAWLAVSVMCVYFVRRRPLLNVVSATFGLVPLLLAAAAGFAWTDGLAAARRDLAERVGPHRSALVWGFLGLAVVVLACGPAIVASARKVRMTPGWPFLVGPVLGVGFSVLAGLARGEAERSWLPFFPWLLVAAVAPDRPGGKPTLTPVWLVAGGVLAAVLIEALLATPW